MARLALAPARSAAIITTLVPARSRSAASAARTEAIRSVVPAEAAAVAPAALGALAAVRAAGEEALPAAAALAEADNHRQTGVPGSHIGRRRACAFTKKRRRAADSGGELWA